MTDKYQMSHSENPHSHAQLIDNYLIKLKKKKRQKKLICELKVKHKKVKHAAKRG